MTNVIIVKGTFKGTMPVLGDRYGDKTKSFTCFFSFLFSIYCIFVGCIVNKF